MVTGDTLNNVEDQPLPESGATPESNAAFQEAVQDLGQQLLRRFQLSGNQFNALELELRVFILVEQVNVLTKIIQTITGSYDDDALTKTMTRQVGLLAKTLEAELAKAPRIALTGAPPPSRLNGKH
jgi:hypothetical protein